MSASTRLSTHLLLAAAGALLALGACSSEVDPATSGGTGATAAPADDNSGTTPSPNGTTGGTSAPGPEGTGPVDTRSEETIEEYYRKLGVEEPVIDCYLDALNELGVTSLGQLEDDQALGIAAADRFDTCVSDVS